MLVLYSLLAALTSAADLTAMDRAIVAALRRAVPALQDAAVIQRLAMNQQLDLVLTIGWPRRVNLVTSGEYPWSPHDRIGLFLHDKTNAGRIFQLALEPGPNNDCFMKVERMTAQELVLSCTGEKWATYENQKFVYDAGAKALVKRFSYAPFRTSEILQTRRGPQFVMSDNQRVLLVEMDQSTAMPRVVPATEARSVLLKIPMQESTAGNQTFLTPAPPPDPVSDFGPGKRFRLSQENNKYGSAFPVIVERQDNRKRFYRLPQSGLKTWEAARPDDAKASLRPDPAEMNEQIGPHQLEANRLWFGKTFYNSEGLTGVGGFGYFDTVARSYKLYAPPEILRWSVSAILVEPDSIWLALYRRGEYGDSPGGLLWWDRLTEQAAHFDTRSIVTNIARSGDALCLGATNGILVLKNNQIQSYFIDRTSDARYRAVARENASR